MKGKALKCSLNESSSAEANSSFLEFCSRNVPEAIAFGNFQQPYPEVSLLPLSVTRQRFDPSKAVPRGSRCPLRDVPDIFPRTPGSWGFPAAAGPSGEVSPCFVPTPRGAARCPCPHPIPAGGASPGLRAERGGAGGGGACPHHHE